MSDEELIEHLRDTTVFVVSKKDVADRIEQLVATNEQLVMERDTIREAALREAAALCDWYPYVEGVRTAIYELMGVKVCS